MICPPCCQAGELNALANQQADAQRGFSGDLLRKFAEEKHTTCHGASHCDCQHVVGQVLNMIEVAKLSVVTVELPSSEPPAEITATASLEGSPTAEHVPATG